MKGRRRTIIIAGSLLFIGCLVLFTTLRSAAIARQLHAWKLLPEPERLTELYFTDHTKLPTTYTTDETQTVAFSVHNLENRTTHYVYRITQSAADGSQDTVLASDTLTLDQNQRSDVTKTVALTDLGPKSRITVVLDTGPSSQSVYYLVTKQGGGQ